VLDVHNHPRSYVADNCHQKKRRRSKRYNGGGQQSSTTNRQPCSMELQRAINAVAEYGRQAHAMGAIRAVNLLMNIAARLKVLAGEPRPAELLDLARETEIAVEEIRGTISRAYEPA
jgi:hypothetical protein